MDQDKEQVEIVIVDNSECHLHTGNILQIYDTLLHVQEIKQADNAYYYSVNSVDAVEAKEIAAALHKKQRRNNKNVSNAAPDTPTMVMEAPADYNNYTPAVLVINTQYFNNTKLSRVLATLDARGVVLTAGEDFKFALDLSQKKIDFVQIFNKNDIRLKNSTATINQMDMAAMNAVYTLLCNGYITFSVQWIARVISGNLNQLPTNQKLKETEDLIDKLRCLFIEVTDISEKNKKTTIKIKEAALLPLEKEIIVTDEKSKVMYTLTTTPAIFKYAEDAGKGKQGQIASAPAKLLNTGKLFKNNEESIKIKRYIVQHIMQAKNSKNEIGNKLSFLWIDKKNICRGLLPELGYVPITVPTNTTAESAIKKFNTEHSKKKDRIHKVVKLTLQHLVEQGELKAYEPYRQGDSNNRTLPIMGYKFTW